MSGGSRIPHLMPGTPLYIRPGTNYLMAVADRAETLTRHIYETEGVTLPFDLRFDTDGIVFEGSLPEWSLRKSIRRKWTQLESSNLDLAFQTLAQVAHGLLEDRKTALKGAGYSRAEPVVADYYNGVRVIIVPPGFEVAMPDGTRFTVIPGEAVTHQHKTYMVQADYDQIKAHAEANQGAAT